MIDLDPVSPLPDETPHAFVQRVLQIMVPATAARCRAEGYSPDSSDERARHVEEGISYLSEDEAEYVALSCANLYPADTTTSEPEQIDHVLIGNYVAQYDNDAGGCMLEPDDARALARQLKLMQAALVDTTPIPRDVYFSPKDDRFYGALRRNCGLEFYRKWYPRRAEFPHSYAEMEALQLRREATAPKPQPDPIPTGVYYSPESGNFYESSHKACDLYFHSKWGHRCGEFPQSYEALEDRPQLPQPQAQQPPQILKGVGIRDGDGWKDVTRKGEIVYVWNSPLPPPNAPGSYPRVLHPGWAASTSQFAFSPATVEEVRELLLSMSSASKESGQ